MRKSTRSNQAGGRWRTAPEIEQILAEYRQSGLTQQMFAQAAGVSLSTLQRWLRPTRSGRRVLRGASSRGSYPTNISLIEVGLGGAAASGSACAQIYEIEFRGGEHLRLATGFSDHEVRRLLALLREAR